MGLVRQHSGTILVTEPVQITQLSLTGAPTSLPSLPSGDLGNQILQVTIRSVDQPWEWRFGTSGAYFYMATQDIIVLPMRDRVALEAFQFKAVSAPADMRIIYEA